jgi:outer membrane lipoprotein-sorting protein
MVKRVDSERIAIDTGNFLPVVREMYEKGQLTYRLQLEGIKINVHEPNAFKLD